MFRIKTRILADHRRGLHGCTFKMRTNNDLPLDGTPFVGLLCVAVSKSDLLDLEEFK